MPQTMVAPLGSPRSTSIGLPVADDASASGISWAAVIGGAFVTASLSLILLALGAGIGLSSTSPWSNAGVSAATVGRASIVWLIIIEIISSAMGGYLAGRLRTKWVNVHTDEVFFRDTAHGFLVWSVGVVISATFLGAAAASMVGGGAGLAVQGASSSNANQYFVDTLFRSDNPTPDPNDAARRSETSMILGTALRNGEMATADQNYVTSIVSAKTGLSQTDAQNRVSEVYAQARQSMDTARKSVAHSLFWLFLALLVGAFCASYSATIGGRQRDHVSAAF